MLNQDGLYPVLKYTAIALGVTFIVWLLYDGVLKDAVEPLQANYNRATREFKDGRYDYALRSYEAVLQLEQKHEGALSGKAASLAMLGQYNEALRIYDYLVREYPHDGIHYANRGILHDKMGAYRRAIADYEKAYTMDQDLNKGPGWLTRFLRNQQEAPATIIARANYLKEQLALPPQEQVLRDPTEDKRQRPYTRR